MSSNNNQINVPQAKEAMERFKMECANEVGVNLKQGYNGDISATLLLIRESFSYRTILL